MAGLRTVEIEVPVGCINIPLVDLEIPEFPTKLECVGPPDLRKAVRGVPGVVELSGGADVPSETEVDLAIERDRRHGLPAVGSGVDNAKRAHSGDEAEAGERYWFVCRLVAHGRDPREVEAGFIHSRGPERKSICQHALLDALWRKRPEVAKSGAVHARTDGGGIVEVVISIPVPRSAGVEIDPLSGFIVANRTYHTWRDESGRSGVRKRNVGLEQIRGDRRDCAGRDHAVRKNAIRRARAVRAAIRLISRDDVAQAL